MIIPICTLLILMCLILSISQKQHAYVLILAAYPLLILLCKTTNLVDFTILSAFLNMTFVGLLYFKKNRRLASEIKFKILFSSLFYFCFLSAGIALSLQSVGTTELSIIAAQPQAKLALSFIWIAALLWIGSVPFLSTHVDILDAAPSFSSVLFLGTVLISGGRFMSILAESNLDPKLFKILAFFAGASLLIPPILGLDQKRISRMLAYLLMTQSGLLLLLVLFKIPVLPVFYFHAVIAIPGALTGIRFWKHRQNSDKNWEDFSGAGRKHPFVSVSWLFILSSFAGIPPSLGFWLYGELAQKAVHTEAYWVLPLVIIAIVVSMIPIVRLGVFMFAKPIRHELLQRHQPRQGFLIIACALLIFSTKIICLALPNSHELQNFMLQFFHLWL